MVWYQITLFVLERHPRLVRLANDRRKWNYKQLVSQIVDYIEPTLTPIARVGLFDALYEADSSSKDVQDILSMFDTLDKSCPR